MDDEVENKIEEEVEETVFDDNNDEIQEEESDFKGEFHERDKLTENNIVDEVESSFIEYSMSVIVERAIPDVRDGLCIIQDIHLINHIKNVLKLLEKLWVITIHMVIHLYMKLW